MTNIKRLSPKVPRNFPQCQAMRVSTYQEDKRCLTKAKYLLDNKYYCTRHAMVKALNILLDEAGE